MRIAADESRIFFGRWFTASSFHYVMLRRDLSNATERVDLASIPGRSKAQWRSRISGMDPGLFSGALASLANAAAVVLYRVLRARIHLAES